MLELLWIAPKNESRPKANAEAVNYKYTTHSNPGMRRELQIAVVGNGSVTWGPELSGAENI